MAEGLIKQGMDEPRAGLQPLGSPVSGRRLGFLPRWGWKRWAALVTGLVLVGAGAGGYAALNAPTAQPTVAVTYGTVERLVAATGTVEAPGLLALNFAVPGTVAQVLVAIGDRVAPGQVLIRLDASSQQDAVLQAQATLQNALAGVNNTRAGVSSAQAGVQTAESNLLLAQNPLTNSQIQQLRDAVAAAQRNYTATVNSVNTTNWTDASKLAYDEVQVPQNTPLVLADATQLAQDRTGGLLRMAQAQEALTNALNALKVQSEFKPNQVDAARAQLASAMAQLAAAQAQVGAAQAQVASAQAQVASAQVPLGQMSITAPVDGTVEAINAKVGQLSATQGGGLNPPPAISLLPVGSLQVTTQLAEADVNLVTVGQTVSVVVDALGGRALPAHLTHVARVATASADGVSTYKAEVSPDAPPDSLRQGMHVTVNAVIAHADHVLVVPNTALHYSGGGYAVQRLRGDGHFDDVTVRLGIRGLATSQVVSGLSAGERVARLNGANVSGP